MKSMLSRQDRERLDELFELAVDLPAEEHAAFLNRECGAHPTLRAELARLLAGLVGEDRLGRAGTSASLRPGTQVGPYSIVEQIGEGGMGEVYLAEQSEPLARRVALKLIKAGMDTRQVVARFEAERQALAVMDHPGIARVFDAGSTEAGRPYFVMEYIQGTPVLEYCDAQDLGTRGRLELFVGICHAIQHAHQKGIIHRDIKPSNVLVTLHDGRPLPKVIDFGIAKAIDLEQVSRTVLTQERQMVGTPMYMSPEQAGMARTDIDTRTDVYSLGVLLYELLTGTTPFDAEELLDRGFVEMLRVISEETPPKPSTRISTLDETASRTAIRPAGDVRRLGLSLRGDLDWIVMRCLEKDRGRRYETADSLAADIERHLRDEPVLAGPPSTAYRLQKFVKRNRVGVLAAALVAVILLLGIGGTGWGMLWALDEKERADGEAKSALAAKGRADREAKNALAAKARADGEARNALAAQAKEAQRAKELQQVADFQAERLAVIDAMKMGVLLRRALIDEAPEAQREQLTQSLAGINFTDVALGSLEDNLFRRTLDVIDTQFATQPRVQAQLLHAMASALWRVGLGELANEPQIKALELRRAELGDLHPDTLASLIRMGELLTGQARYSDAHEFCTEALASCRLVFGDNDLMTLRAKMSLALLLMDQGELVEAEPLYRDVVAGRRRLLGDDHRDTLFAISRQGVFFEAQGDLAAAEQRTREALDGYQRVLGPDHPETLGTQGNLGALLQTQRRYLESVPFMRASLDGRRRTLGDDHPNTLLSVANLAAALMLVDEFEESESLCLEALAGQRRERGDDHPSTLRALDSLGGLYQRWGRLAEAERYKREALEGCLKALDADHPRTVTSKQSMGSLLTDQGRFAEAVPYLREALESSRRSLGNDHWKTLGVGSLLGFSYLRLGRFSEAIPLLEEGHRARHEVPGLEWVGKPLRDAYAGTLKILRARVDEARSSRSADDTLATHLAELGLVLLGTQEWGEAEEVLGECLELFEQIDPEAWTTFDALSMLGSALLGQSQFGEAEELLLAGFEGMAERQATIPEAGRHRLTRALERIVALYTAWELAKPGADHAAQAAEWQAELDIARQE